MSCTLQCTKKNQQFISTLNSICTNSQTKESVQYINRNYVGSTYNDRTSPYLFYRNKDIVIHNNKIISIVPDDEIGINVIDNLEENHGNVHFHLHTSTFPLQIVLKLNILSEIYARNYDSQDGLIDGVDGIMKAYRNTKELDVIHINFNDSNIGHGEAKEIYFL